MRLHYGAPQTAIAFVFAVIVVALVVLFVTVALRSRRAVAFEGVRDTGYRIRRWWFATLLVLLVAVVGTSLTLLPFPSAAPGRTLVRVSGGQFYWSTSPARVPAGTHVVFDVTSADVNHAMGLYDPAGHLIGSVQAMPGYHNRLDVTLDRAGRYTFACLEYCGLRHHLMARTFTVGGGGA